MNTFSITGNLGSDPEGKATPTGFVCNFSVAVTSYHRDDSDQPMWVQVAAWNELGEACHKHLKKGRKVFVQGRLEYDPKTGGPTIFKRKNETAGATFEMIAALVEFLDSPEPREEKE
jgi:single-strand DNA-binding protein